MSRVAPSLFFLFVVSTPTVVQGQEEVDPILSGRLLVSGLPADTGTVVLHRVTPEEAGDIDSTSVGAEGGFSFRLPNLPVPGSGEIFIASTRLDDILYAGVPISDPIQLDSLYTIRAFPAQMAPPEGMTFPISRREVWVDEGPIGWQITDVLEIRNSQAMTLVPQVDDGPVWQYPLPSAAIGARILQVGPSAGPARVDGSTLVASNPVLPAENYYIVQYDLESIEFDIPLPGETGLVQVMVREPAPAIRVEGLARQPSEEIEVGASFMRWAGQTLVDQNLSVRLGEEGGSTAVVWMSTALALLLAGAGSLVIRRDSVPVAHGASVRIRKEILVDVAKLDEAYAGLKRSNPKEEARYRRRRSALVRELEPKRGGGDPPAPR